MWSHHNLRNLEEMEISDILRAVCDSNLCISMTTLSTMKLFCSSQSSLIDAHWGVHKTIDAITKRFCLPGMSVNMPVEKKKKKKISANALFSFMCSLTIKTKSLKVFWVTHCEVCQRKITSLKTQAGYTRCMVSHVCLKDRGRILLWCSNYV